jgi:hypothetical protein
MRPIELYPICLLAVWPVSVSYRHLPVGIFGMVCTVFFILYDLAGAPFCEILRELPSKGGAWSIKKGAEAREKGVPAKCTIPNVLTKFSFGIG